MRGVAARYPVFDARLGRPITLAQRIEQCRVERQGAAPLAPDSDALLGLTAYVGLQSRGHADAGRHRWSGAAVLRSRQGTVQRCARASSICPAPSATTGWQASGLAGSVIPQGHPNGYPEYRLEWQGMGSLERRIRNCMVGVRAEPFARGLAGTGRS